MQFKNLFGLIFVIFSSHIIFADTVGSDTAVSVEPGYTFPSATNNRIATFGFLKSGFTLTDSLTTCTFDSIFPVSGYVQLNGGTLYLNQDLIFNNITTLQGLGSLVANNHMLNFCNSINSLPAETENFSNARINLNGRLNVNSTITFSGNNAIDGANNDLIFNPNSSITIGSNSSLLLKNLSLQQVTNSSIILTDNTSTLTLHNVDMDLLTNFTFAQGALYIVGDVTMSGTQGFYYTSSMTSTIAQNSQLTMCNGTTLSIGRTSATTSVQPLAFVDNSSILRLDGANFVVTSFGATITNGTISISRLVPFDVLSTSSATGLILGNGQAANDCMIYLDASAVMHLQSGAFAYNCASPNNIVSSSINTQFIRSSGSLVYIATNLNFPSCTSVVDTQSVPVLQLAPGSTLTYNNVHVVLPQSEFLLTCNRASASTFFLSGNNNSIFLSKGLVPLSIQVASSPNTIQGNGHLTGPLALQDGNAQLTINLQGKIENNITLNGGTVILNGDLYLASDVNITGSGNITLNTYTLNLPSVDYTLTSSLFFSGSAGVVMLNGKLSLDTTCTVNGNVIIDGQSNVLEFEPTGIIHVNSNSQLTLKNITLNDIATANLVLQDDTSSLILDNVAWIQNGDYQFPYGSIKFLNEVDMYGTYSFIYQSSQTSTITQHATWHLANGITLNIGRYNQNTTVQPLNFMDLSSLLMMDDSTIIINENGVQFTKGTVAIVRDTTIDVVSTSSTNGLILGNGVSSGDMIFDLYPGCSAHFTGGAVVYDITNVNGILASNDTVNIVRDDASVFWLNQNLVMQNMSLDVSEGATLYIADGYSLEYLNATMNIAQGSFTLDGIRYNPYTTLLGGSQSIFMIKGTIPMYTLVVGTGNALQGNGNIGGGLILQDSSAQLTWDLQGTLLSDLELNGGTLMLDSDFYCANGIQMFGPGLVNLGNNSFNLGQNDLAWTTAVDWQGASGVVNVNSNLTLSNVWTFSGQCILDLNNHVLDLTNGSIVVEQDSTLIIKNANIQNIADMAISCTDNTGLIVLDNVMWHQSDNSQFSYGALQFKNHVSFVGTYTFAYDSVQTATILPHSTVLLDTGFTFSFDQTNSGISNNLVFVDSTAQLTLNNATLFAGGPGLVLTNGTINILQTCAFMSEITDMYGDPGISIGDGVTDCMCNIPANASLQCTQGSLNYNNLDLASLYAPSQTANITITNYATFRLYQSLPPQCMLNLENSTYAKAVNADALGSMNLIGPDVSYENL